MMTRIRMNPISSFARLSPKQGYPNPLKIFSSTFHSSNQTPILNPNRNYIFADIKNLDNAQTLFNHMLQMNPLPPICDYNKLLNIVVKMKCYSQVVIYFKKLILQGCRVNEFIMSTVINCYCKLKEIESGFAVLACFLKRGYPPNVISITCLVNGLCRNRMVDEALSLLSKMIETRMSPDAVAFNALVNAYCKEGLLEKADDVVRIMSERGMRPDVRTYISLMSALFKNGKFQDAMLYYREVDSEGLDDVVFYTIVIHGLCNSNQIHLARTIFDNLSVKGLYPNVVTYNVMMKGLCKEGMFQEVKELLEKMEKCGCFPDSITYNTMMVGCLKHCDSCDSLEILRQIAGKDFALDASTFSLVLQQMQGRDEDLGKKSSLMQKFVSNDTRCLIA